MAQKLSHTLLTLCFLLCLLAPAASAQEASFANSETASPRETRLKVFDQVWRAVNETYYDRNFHGVDWLTQRQLYRPQAEAARDNAEFYRILRNMISRLGDAHTRIYSPDDGFDRYRPAGTTVGITVRRVEGRAVITSVDPTSEAARQGVRAGLVVKAIDGAPVEQLVARIGEEIGHSSTPTARELQSYDRLFYGPRDTAVMLTLVNEEGQSRAVTLARRFVEFQRRVTMRQLPYNLGYIEVSGFGPEIERDFDKAMQSLQHTRGLVLDLRNNGGGFVSTVTLLASYFFSDETDLGEFITRQGRSTRRQTQRMRTLYRAPVVVLVSQRSASGSEIFAAAMQERKRGLVVGTTPATCGCLLGVSRTWRLADGGKLNVSDTDFRTAQGRRIEGVGIQPDQQVGMRIADLAAGRDNVLETAVDHINRNLLFGPRGLAAEFHLRIPELSPKSASPSLPAAQFNR